MSGSSQVEQLARDFLDALTRADPAAFERILADDVSLRAWGWGGSVARRPRARVIGHLLAEASAWPDPTLQVLSLLALADHVAVEYRIQATADGRYVEHNRAAFLKMEAGRISSIDLYYAAPLPSARRRYTAPASLTATQVHSLLRDFQNTYDPREYVTPYVDRFDSLSIRFEESGDPHPGSNDVRWASFTAAEADARIEEIIADHRRRNIGFWWFTGPYDSPPDLAERLRRHGLVWAGDNLTMVRLGLDSLDIPTNPAVEVKLLDAATDADTEAALQVSGACFHWTAGQIADRRSGWFAQVKNPAIAPDHLLYLARLDGRPVAFAHTVLKSGVAFLAGAGTLPEHRSRHIYSTLLHRRLVDARAHGYQVSVIYAGPMSRRVAVKYGFKVYDRFDIFAWMPVIDMAVIKGLIVDE